jgi:hypothetical protein
MMTLRHWTLRVLSPLLVGGFGLLTATGCPLPKQDDNDESGECSDGGSDEGDTCGPNDPEL